MAYWGQALVLGPNINAPMAPEAEPKALALLQKAIALKAKATRARARLHRRAGGALHRQAPTIARRPIAPMPTRCEKLTRAFPDDLDARTLYAESLMDLRPWGYFTRDGQPHDETTQVQSALAVRDRQAPERIPARCTCGFTCGSRPIRSARKPKPIASCR